MDTMSEDSRKPVADDHETCDTGVAEMAEGGAHYYSAEGADDQKRSGEERGVSSVVDTEGMQRAFVVEVTGPRGRPGHWGCSMENSGAEEECALG